MNGIEATGCAAVISPVLLISGAPSWTSGAAPMAFEPDMIACDLRW